MNPVKRVLDSNKFPPLQHAQRITDMGGSPILGKYHSLERLGAGAHGNLPSSHIATQADK